MNTLRTKNSARRRQRFFRALLCVFTTAMSFSGLAQKLNLPPRPPNAPTGSQFAGIITSMPLTEREQWIYTQIASGNVPNFLRKLVPVTTNATLHGTNFTITYFVTPDYLAVGSDADYFLCPMTPLLGQRLADLLNCSLPTRRMVNDIWSRAPVKLAPSPVLPSAEMITVPVFIQHNNTVRAQRDAKTNSFPLGALVGGDKKDVVISARIYTNFANANITKPVVIYGWHKLDGSPIQPLYNGHEETYADYSHGIRLVQMNLSVNGVVQTLTNILTNPNLASLLSDETTYPGNTLPVPRYTIAATPPAITTQPVNQTVSPGENVEFSVVAAGTPPLRYQWKYNGTNLAKATNAIFVLTNAQAASAGFYTVAISNSVGFASSLPAILRVERTENSILFQDDFETNSAPNWNVFWGSGNNVADYTVDWSFDYGTNVYSFSARHYVIPPAPHSTNGTTRGVKLTVNNNDANAWIAGVSLYPRNKNFSGNYVLKCDVWINYPGNAGGTGASGSTQHALFGISHQGTQVNWAATNASASDGIWFAADGEGDTTRDYRAYLGNLSGNATELTGASSGLIAADNTTGFFQSLFPSTRFESAGAPGKNWVAVEVMQTNNTIIWRLDGAVVAQRTNTSNFTNGTIMLGLMDVFPSLANPAKDSFVIFDNVRVEALGALRFDRITLLPDGRRQISLLGAAGAEYSIETSSNLSNWTSLGVLLGSNSASVFVDDSASDSHRFYRARQTVSP